VDTTDLRYAVSGLWWLGVLRATAAILFGIVTVFWPGLTLTALIYLLAAFILAIGLVETIAGIMSINRRNNWWLTLLVGLAAIGVGVYLAGHPDASLRTFILIVGIWFISWGVLDLMVAFMSRLSTGNRVLSFIAGVAGLAAGIVVLLQPVSGGLAFAWVLGLYGIIYGVMNLASAIELRDDFEQLTAPGRA
jgi:uncharacterized membrane protein HdeD (DUF308 family)